MKQTTRRLLCLLLVLALLTGAGLLQIVAADQEPCYEYRLVPQRYGAGNLLVHDGAADGLVVLDLYVVSRTADGGADVDAPPLHAGAFGLRLPDWITDVTFALPADDTVMTQPLVPAGRYDAETTVDPATLALYHDGADGSRYHAFAWTGRMESGPVGAIHPDWKLRSEAGDEGFYGLKLGTYSFRLPYKNGSNADDGYRLPVRGDVDLLDWMTAGESALAPGETVHSSADMLNKTIWNKRTGAYQGYYDDGIPEAGSDAGLLEQTDIGFRLLMPESWAGVRPVFSYDPKKTISGKILDAEGRHVAKLNGAAQAAAVWQSSTGDQANWCYPVRDQNAGTGENAYYTGLRLDSGGLDFSGSEIRRIEAGKTYTLVLTKPGHLERTLELTAESDNTLEDARGFPEGEPLRLLPGDLNEDGSIDLEDRAILLGVLGRNAGSDPMTTAYKADFDGDGVVSLSDLAILMSPENYLHQAE